MANMRILVLLLSLLVLLVADESSAKVSAIIVFGDSSVDAGNNNVISAVLKSNFQPYGRDFEGDRPTGRFSNGRIRPDFISQAFGLKPAILAYLDPLYTISDFATGVCFASAGTGYDNATSEVLNVIPLWEELESFKVYQNKLRAYFGNEKAKEIEDITNWGSSNGAFATGGTTNFIGQHDCLEEYNNVALEFNGKLEGLVSQLNKELLGLKMLFTRNAYDVFHDIIRRPSQYGKLY
ncbi:hypothetical protein GH714_031265 [Hevea brasiliensis]|uniref:GDSL esterase/lipase n=1 Tax=Hevea brasiliensis TaxID=3981 RepID=A0A6A6K8L9_HEVBR|nr:hypothetical protein GH714_031265 [Hevea brasiliensis]